ncbi:unnamed protein product [Peniophora sp. CBMAI 1063]|nr:unnamed protein product [Peniophora sp. CBMAI 1063]
MSSTRALQTAVLFRLPPEVLSNILPVLDGSALIALSQSCSLFKTLVADEWRRRVYYKTRMHVSDAASLYSMLDGIGGVVSGSTPFSLLQSSNCDFSLPPWVTGSDLDIYVPDVASRDTLIAYLHKEDGYGDVPFTSAFDERYWEDPSVITSITRLASDRFSGHVDVVCARGGSAVMPILSFWSTLVMNFVTGSRIIVLYPRTTLSGRGYTNPTSHSDKLQACTQKYQDRGFAVGRFPHTADECHDPDNYCPSKLRYTEDCQTLSITWKSDASQPRTVARAPSFGRRRFSVPPAFWTWSACRAQSDFFFPNSVIRLL